MRKLADEETDMYIQSSLPEITTLVSGRTGIQINQVSLAQNLSLKALLANIEFESVILYSWIYKYEYI